MKKILFRKLLYDCLIFFTITLFSSSLIIWVFQAVNYLDLIIDDGRNYSVYLQYTFLNLPKIISRILPTIFFISLFYMIIKYESNNCKKCKEHVGFDAKSLQTVELPTGSSKYVKNRYLQFIRFYSKI